MNKRLAHFFRDTNRWTASTLLLTIFITIPLTILWAYLLEGRGEMWSHLQRYLLPTYLSNSLILVIGTTALTLTLGVGAAWLVTQYRFVGQRWMDGLLFLPLAIPSYIMAYAYVGALGNGGTLMVSLQSLGADIQRIEMKNIVGLIWVLSLSLYPYVYAAARALFRQLPAYLRESAYLLGTSESRFFFRVALPLSIPAATAGLFLVIMEVFNDYGAAKYFGVNTFTTGIFRTWTALEDLQSALYLCAMLVVIVFVILMVLRWLQRYRNYTIPPTTQQELKRSQRSLSKRHQLMVIAFLSIPLIGGLILPMGQLLYWATLTYDTMLNFALVELTLQSCGLAMAAAGCCVLLAVLLIYSNRWNELQRTKWLPRLATLGYIIPGAIIGISVLRSSQVVIDFFATKLNMEIGYLFFGSSIILLYAYTFRFLAVAHNPLAAHVEKQQKNLAHTAYLLGASKLKALWTVELPLLRTALLSAFLLVFVDVLKELPLTLILKSYKIQTLAVNAYEYADDERVSEAALPALVLILISAVLLIILKRQD